MAKRNDPKKLTPDWEERITEACKSKWPGALVEGLPVSNETPSLSPLLGAASDFEHACADVNRIEAELDRALTRRASAKERLDETIVRTAEGKR